MHVSVEKSNRVMVHLSRLISWKLAMLTTVAAADAATSESFQKKEKDV